MVDKFTFMKRAAIGTAVLCAIAFVLVGIFCPIEPGMSVFGHIMKCVFGWAWVTVILETMMYTAGQIAYHWTKDNKDKYGEHWFKEGVKDDLKYFKSLMTKNNIRKVLCWVFGFLLAAGALIFILELIFP